MMTVPPLILLAAGTTQCVIPCRAGMSSLVAPEQQEGQHPMRMQAFLGA